MSEEWDCKVYVGGLGDRVNPHELQEAFSYYGPIREVFVGQNPNPRGYAFITFDNSKDARDAVRALNGKILCGCHARVELAIQDSTSSYYQQPQRCYECGEPGHFARDCIRRSRQ